jgi:succinate dehydrogenase hydrophobic anchor subunit
MDNTRTEHSRLGIASFILALVPGLAFIALVLLFVLQARTASQFQEYAAGWGVLTFMLVLTIALSEIAALVLGIAGALQRRRKRLFAFLGIAICVLALTFGYVQDVILPAWM